MARVTVEDCLSKVQNRFELVVLAAKRGKDISSGAPIFVARDNDKNGVIALREIAQERVSIEDLRRSLKNNVKNSKKVLFANKDDALEDDINTEILEDLSMSPDHIDAEYDNSQIEEELFAEDDIMMDEEDDEDEDAILGKKKNADQILENAFSGVKFSDDDVDIDD